MTSPFAHITSTLFISVPYYTYIDACECGCVAVALGELHTWTLTAREQIIFYVGYVYLKVKIWNDGQARFGITTMEMCDKEAKPNKITEK